MFDYKSYIKSLANFMVDNGYTVRPLPKIRLSNVKQHGLFIMTGYYDNEDGVITVFINGRHPKDVLRTVAHELIHHKQSEEEDVLIRICKKKQINRQYERSEMDAFFVEKQYVSPYFYEKVVILWLVTARKTMMKWRNMPMTTLKA